MKTVLVLGAGLVSRPMVRHLLELPDFRVVVASRTKSKAEELVQSHPRGTALGLLAEDEAALRRLIADSNLVVSLLPWTLHLVVARHCLELKKHLVTTSYVSEGMRQLDGPARAAGVLFLNEIGLDPGIDHMSAMKVIDDVRQKGGQVTGFVSYCGGLPAPEANDNPFGYKFSWSPRGVLLAGRNEARYLKEGKEVVVPAQELFNHRWPVTVEGAGRFEAYPNRNSLPYIATYRLDGVRTMLRGTLRNPGWCETMKAIIDLGLIRDDTVRTGLKDMTYARWLRRFAPGSGDLRSECAARLGLSRDHPVLERLAWLGLFEERPIGLEQGADVDVLAKLMFEKMSYKPGERDMIVLHHEFEVEYPDRPRERRFSTLVSFGEPAGDSAMARTVSLPAAIAVRLILEGRIRLTGVQIPVMPEIYLPVLAELSRLGITCQERIAG
ncbi:MAG: saccharopine dehydrogenase C-terminal domain-containing protein [candidate division WOR-3 bacterium]